MGPGDWLLVAAFTTAAGTAGLLRYLWRYRTKPGADWFLASLACQALWSGTYGVALLVFDPLVRWVLEVVMLAFLIGLSLFFWVFALEYTGRGAIPEGFPRAAVVLVPVATGVGAATNPLHHLFWTGYRFDSVAGLATVDYAFEPLALVLGTIAITLPFVGSVLLFDTVVSYGPLYRREAVAVGLSTLPPIVGFGIWLYGLGPVPQVNLAVILFLPHVVLDAYAFVGSDMFEFHPATRRAGERAAIDDLGSPVVILDERGRVVTLNAAAESVLDVSKAAVLTDPIDDYLEESIDPEAGDQRIAIRTDGTRRVFSVTPTPLTDGRGDLVGHTLVWQDVTETIRREQRLEVLNRVLRHNLRNDLGVVSGFVDFARENIDYEEVEGMLRRAADTADELVAHSEAAREIEHVLGEKPDPVPVDVRAVVSDVVEEAREAVPAATVDLEGPSLTVTADRTTLRAVCRALVDNAVRHTGPDPNVTVSVDPDDVAIRVSDDGPGIPEHELAVIESGDETQLEHGSGLGLWLARWGTQRLGGDLSFETGEEGTTATLSLARA